LIKKSMGKAVSNFSWK